MHAPTASTRLNHWLLLGGLLLGIVLATFSIVQQNKPTLEPHVMAQVGSRTITQDAYTRAINSVEQDRRTPLTLADKQRILSRMVDEELLVQHGIALGLVENDRSLRSAVVREVMNSVAQSVAVDAIADDAALKKHYLQHRSYFALPARLQVQAVSFSDSITATAAYQTIQTGASFEQATQTAEAWLPPIPQTLLPPAKLRTYLGPALTQVALTLKAGEVSPPQLVDGRISIVKTLHLEMDKALPFEQLSPEMKATAQAHYERSQNEQAIRDLLDDLRRDYAVQQRSITATSPP